MPEPTDAEFALDPAEMERLDPNIRAELRKSRQRDAENKAQAEENEALKRELTFAKAGIPDTPLGELFKKGFDGDAKDPAAVKAAFEALGVPTGEGGDTGQEGANDPTDEELEAQRRLAQVGADGGTTGGQRDFATALNGAGSVKEVLDLVANAPESAGVATVTVQ